MNKPPRLDLNPSSAERWTRCTASPHFILGNADKIPDQSSRYADEGTTAHEVGAAMLEGREPNLKECPTPITAEMRWHAWNYMEYVYSLVEDHSTVVVEKKYPLWYMPERNAKVDVVVSNRQGLHIVDLKYGEGIPVSPIENLQAAIYARTVLGSIDQGRHSPHFPITIHIYQPRGREAVQPHHTWETTWGELKEFTFQNVDRPSMLILHHHKNGQTDFAPSDSACRWCPAKGFCKARQEFFTRDVEVLQGDLQSPPDPQSLSEAQRAAIHRYGPEIQKWIDDVMGYNTDRANEGYVLPGFKLVLSRGGNRRWTDDQHAKAGLSKTILRPEEIVSEKVISVADAEKKLGKHGMPAELDALIFKPPGSPVLVPEDDKRPAILSDLISDLEDESSPK